LSGFTGFCGCSKPSDELCRHYFDGRKTHDWCIVNPRSASLDSASWDDKNDGGSAKEQRIKDCMVEARSIKSIGEAA